MGSKWLSLLEYCEFYYSKMYDPKTPLMYWHLRSKYEAIYEELIKISYDDEQINKR